MSLELIFGPMFSGKSSQLIAQLTNLADTGYSVLLILHASDDRTDVEARDELHSSHSSGYFGLSRKVEVVKVSDLDEVNADEFRVIGIDEAQFFTGLKAKVLQWIKMRKNIRVSGLDGDANMNFFGEILYLIPHANKVEKLNARCLICLKEYQEKNMLGDIPDHNAPFTKKIGGDMSKQTEVGGKDKYIPVCRYHHEN